MSISVSRKGYSNNNRYFVKAGLDHLLDKNLGRTTSFMEYQVSSLLANSLLIFPPKTQPFTFEALKRMVKYCMKLFFQDPN